MPPDLDIEACKGLFVPEKFPGVVNLMSFDEDNDLAVFRKFKRLNISALLFRQSKLIDLEEKMAGCESSKSLHKILSRAWPLLQDYSIAPAL